MIAHKTLIAFTPPFDRSYEKKREDQIGLIVAGVLIFLVFCNALRIMNKPENVAKRREQKRRSEELRIYHREGVLALGCTRTKLLCCCCKCSTVTKRTTFYVLLCNVICTHTQARDILITRFHLLREYHRSIISRTPRSSLPLLTR